MIKKTLTPKQKNIARAAKPTDKITGADFKALKRGQAPKMTLNQRIGM